MRCVGRASARRRPEGRGGRAGVDAAGAGAGGADHDGVARNRGANGRVDHGQRDLRRCGKGLSRGSVCRGGGAVRCVHVTEAGEPVGSLHAGDLGVEGGRPRHRGNGAAPHDRAGREERQGSGEPGPGAAGAEPGGGRARLRGGGGGGGAGVGGRVARAGQRAFGTGRRGPGRRGLPRGARAR